MTALTSARALYVATCIGVSIDGLRLALDWREVEVHDANVVDRHHVVLKARRRDGDRILALDQHRDVARAARFGSEVAVGRQPLAYLQDSLLVVVVASHLKKTRPRVSPEFDDTAGAMLFATTKA